MCVHAVGEPVEAWWHANFLSSNAAMVLQCLVMELQSVTVYGTMLCSYVCMRLIAGGWCVRGMKLGFCICEWVDESNGFFLIFS